MTRTLSLSEAKIKLSELVDNVFRTSNEIVITKNGKPVAVLLNAQDYEGWKETQEILGNPDLMDQLKATEKDLEKGKYKEYTLDELFGPDKE